jgi:hypothetical protein
MQIRIRRIRHIIINHDINPFNIDSPPEDVSSNTNPLIKILEGFITRDSFFLRQATMDCDGGEITFTEETIKLRGSADGFDENNDLVEFEGVEEVVEFAVFLGFGEADKVLLETVQS